VVRTWLTVCETIEGKSSDEGDEGEGGERDERERSNSTRSDGNSTRRKGEKEQGQAVSSSALGRKSKE